VRDVLPLQPLEPDEAWSVAALRRLGFGDVADTQLTAGEAAGVGEAIDALDRLFDRDDDPPAVAVALRKCADVIRPGSIRSALLTAADASAHVDVDEALRITDDLRHLLAAQDIYPPEAP
jgi:hypothetical protein